MASRTMNDEKLCGRNRSNNAKGSAEYRREQDKKEAGWHPAQ